MDRGYAEVKWFDVFFASALLADAAHCGWTCRSLTIGKSKPEAKPKATAAMRQTCNVANIEHAGHEKCGRDTVGEFRHRTRQCQDQNPETGHTQPAAR